MGAKIKGAGTDIIEIEGVKKLKDVSYNIMPDRIETGTFLCIAAMAGGNICIKECNSNHSYIKCNTFSICSEFAEDRTLGL